MGGTFYVTYATASDISNGNNNTTQILSITPTKVSVAGNMTAASFIGNGSQLTDLAVLGMNQTWQDVTASRAKGTTYTNTTGRPIQILVQYQDDGGGAGATFNIGSLTRTTADLGGAANYPYWFSAVIPNGTTYSISGGVNLPAWWELR